MITIILRHSTINNNSGSKYLAQAFSVQVNNINKYSSNRGISIPPGRAFSSAAIKATSFQTMITSTASNSIKYSPPPPLYCHGTCRPATSMKMTIKGVHRYYSNAGPPSLRLSSMLQQRKFSFATTNQGTGPGQKGGVGNALRMTNALNNNHRSENASSSLVADSDLYDTFNDYEEDEDYEEGSNGENENDNTNSASNDDENHEPYNEVVLFAQRLQRSIERTKSTITKKNNSLQNELDKAKNLEQIMKRANLIISNLYQFSGTGAIESKDGNNNNNSDGSTFIVQDWENDGEEIELVLNTKEYDSPQEEADALFSKARKMKRGSKVVEDLLVKTQESLDILEEAEMDLKPILEADVDIDMDIDEGRIHIILERLERSSSKTGFVMIKDSSSDDGRARKMRSQNKGRQGSSRQTRYQPSFRRFLSPNGCIVLVGKNRRDNEAICFQVARGDDIWFHSRGCPGAHVLLQIRRGSPRPTDECMQFAANLAAFYSDARTERKAPVTTASPKHIQKPRGAPPGAVKLREELNTITGYPADVSDELKIAREESGVIWDEAGSRSLGGKARNRKRTKEATKQSIAKKKAGKKSRKMRRADEGSDSFW